MTRIQKQFIGWFVFRQHRTKPAKPSGGLCAVLPKILAAVFALTMTCGLVSCGGTSGTAETQSNATAGFIIECLKKETTEDEIVAKMQKKWEVSEDAARRDVQKIVKQLKGIGAIDG